MRPINDTHMSRYCRVGHLKRIHARLSHFTETSWGGREGEILSRVSFQLLMLKIIERDPLTATPHSHTQINISGKTERTFNFFSSNTTLSLNKDKSDSTCILSTSSSKRNWREEKHKHSVREEQICRAAVVKTVRKFFSHFHSYSLCRSLSIFLWIARECFSFFAKSSHVPDLLARILSIPAGLLSWHEREKCDFRRKAW